MLTDIATQVEHCGHKYPTSIWKVLMMQAWGREVKWMPALDGQGVVPVVFSSSDLTKAEMTSLMEFMAAWGAEHGVIFGDEAERVPDEGEGRSHQAGDCR